MSTILFNPTLVFPAGYVTTLGMVVASPGPGDTTYVVTLPPSINIQGFPTIDLTADVAASLDPVLSGSLTTQDLYLLGQTAFAGTIPFANGLVHLPFTTGTTGAASLLLAANSSVTITGVLAGSAPTAAVVAALKTTIDNVGPLVPASQVNQYNTIKTAVDQFATSTNITPATTGTGSTVNMQANASLSVASLGIDTGSNLTIDFQGGHDLFALTMGAVIPKIIGLTFSEFSSTPGNIIDLQGIGGFKSQTGDVISTTFGTTYTLNGLGTQAYTAMNDAFGGVELIAACFASGTRLLTDGGEVAVERLAVGDHLVSALDGAARAIIWIGSRSVGTGDDAPVRVRADAFGPGLPTRDLVLSPDHALLIDAALIPVRHLVNGGSIARAPGACDTYWHVELAAHDAVFAEGLPAETFLDVGQRFGDEAVSVVVHPSQVARVWEAQGCAPLVVGGPMVAAVRARLRQTVALAA